MASSEKITFKQYLSSSWWSIKLYWKINPFLATLYLTTSFIDELLQITNIYLFARIIDVILEVSQGTRDIVWIYYLLGIMLAFSLTSTIINLMNGYSNRMLQSYAYPKFQEFLYKKLDSLGIQTLEKPEVNNMIARAQQNWRTVEGQFMNITALISSLITVVSTGAIIASFSLSLIPVLIGVVLPYVYLERRYQRKIWREDRRITEERRAAYDSAGILQTSGMLQELVITGGRTLLENRFTEFTTKWNHFLATNRKTFYKKLIGVRVIRGSVEVSIDYMVIMRFIAGKTSIGNVTFYIRSVSSFTSNLQSFTNVFSNSYESALRVVEIKSLFDMEPVHRDGTVVFPRLEEGPAIEFTNVSFTYPNAKREVLKDINISIKKNEKIAIVGHNGAGKTTFVKLLCRFYQVDKGSILVNNQDINELKAQSWYQNIGVLFQDFNTYSHLSVKENIAIGDITKKGTTKRVAHAARRADASDFIKLFGNTYDQVLSEKYKGGIRPSTGQWQKIAIARFFYRNAPLVIFDEPTAAIDAESEARIFNRIYKFFKGKTVIIISHRFSTVRNADRIIVFDKGAVVESGNHAELMKLNGVYARAFNTQAEGYK